MARSLVCRLKEPGKNICFANIFVETHLKMCFFLDSSMVEHAAVNRGVVGSSPIRGAVQSDVKLSVYGPLAQLVRAIGS